MNAPECINQSHPNFHHWKFDMDKTFVLSSACILCMRLQRGSLEPPLFYYYIMSQNCNKFCNLPWIITLVGSSTHVQEVHILHLYIPESSGRASGNSMDHFLVVTGPIFLSIFVSFTVHETVMFPISFVVTGIQFNLIVLPDGFGRTPGVLFLLIAIWQLGSFPSHATPIIMIKRDVALSVNMLRLRNILCCLWRETDYLQKKKKQTMGQIVEVYFVILSKTEYVCHLEYLISLLQNTLSYFYKNIWILCGKLTYIWKHQLWKDVHSNVQVMSLNFANNFINLYLFLKSIFRI